MPDDIRRPAAKARAAPRHRLSTEDRKREIVAAVLVLARESGPDAITTHAIAGRMGVTQGAIFRHFPDKEAIWRAVFAWVRVSLAAAFDDAVRRDEPPLVRLERAFLAHVAFVAANPGVPRVMFHELRSPRDSAVRADVRGMLAKYRQRIVRLFVQARSTGAVAGDLDAGAAAVMFLGAIQGLVIQASLANDTSAMVRQARKLWPLLLGGLCRGRAA